MVFLHTLLIKNDLDKHENVADGLVIVLERTYAKATARDGGR